MQKRVTVTRSDSKVYVDGEDMIVPVDDLPEYFHAVQWYPDADPPYGEIEYAPDRSGRKLPNTRFSDFAPYAFLVGRHVEKKAEIAEQKRVEEVARAAEEEARLAARAARIAAAEEKE